jgi:hypothetical protein
MQSHTPSGQLFFLDVDYSSGIHHQMISDGAVSTTFKKVFDGLGFDLPMVDALRTASAREILDAVEAWTRSTSRQTTATHILFLAGRFVYHHRSYLLVSNSPSSSPWNSRTAIRLEEVYDLLQSSDGGPYIVILHGDSPSALDVNVDIGVRSLRSSNRQAPIGVLALISPDESSRSALLRSLIDALANGSRSHYWSRYDTNITLFQLRSEVRDRLGSRWCFTLGNDRLCLPNAAAVASPEAARGREPIGDEQELPEVQEYRLADPAGGTASVSDFYNLEHTARLDTRQADEVRSRLEHFLGLVHRYLYDGAYPAPIELRVERELSALRGELYDNFDEPLGGVVQSYMTSLLEATVGLLDIRDLTSAAELKGVDPKGLTEIVEAAVGPLADSKDISPAISIADNAPVLSPDSETLSGQSRANWAAKVVGWVTTSTIAAAGTGGAFSGVEQIVDLSFLSPEWAAIIGACFGLAGAMAKIVSDETDHDEKQDSSSIP